MSCSRFGLGCVFGIVALLVAGASARAVTAVTSADQRHQVINGWGATVGGDHTDPAWRAAYRDLGMNILRVSMDKEVLVHAADDFATPVALTDDLSSNLTLMGADAPRLDNPPSTGFGRLDTRGQTAEWLKQNALEPDRVRISGSLWSPPHWMKGPTGATQHFVDITEPHPTPFLSNQDSVQWLIPDNIRPSRKPFGASVGGRLKTEDPWTLDQYGKYIASWTAGWNRRFDADLDVVSIQNESNFENPFDSMTLSVDQHGKTDFSQYALALESVRQAWEAFGLDTSVMGPHHANFRDNPAAPWSMWRQLMMIKAVKEHSDPQLIEFLDYFNANFYNGTSEGNTKNVAAFFEGSDAVPGNWNPDFLANAGELARRGVGPEGKGIWFSETGDGGGSAWTGPNGQIQTALKIHQALVHGQASAYLYWQFSDGRGGALTQHVLLSDDQLDDPLQSKKYAAFKHYSRFIRPGAERLAVTFAEPGYAAASIGGDNAFDINHALNISGFLHEQDRRLTYVLVNMLTDRETVTLDLADLPGPFHEAAFAVYRTSATESFVQLSDLLAVEGQLVFDIPAQSVMTLTASIPEPSAAALLGSGMVGLLLRRRGESAG